MGIIISKCLCLKQHSELDERINCLETVLNDPIYGIKKVVNKNNDSVNSLHQQIDEHLKLIIELKQEIKDLQEILCKEMKAQEFLKQCMHNASMLGKNINI